MAKLKLRFCVIALIAMLLTFFSQGSLAYYSVTGKATNVVTSGNIQFSIHETTDQGLPFPEEGVYILPGDVVSKRVTIESECEHPFYLRVRPVYGINSEELSVEDCFKLNIDEAQWKWVDGWYYYLGIVEPKAETPAVFSHVEIVGSKVDNAYLGSTLQLTVEAQAVQSENNPIEGNDPSSALGWPEVEA